MLKEKILCYINENLSEKRYMHSLNVADEAVRLAKKYGADTEKAYLAGVAHDMVKELHRDLLEEKLIKYNRRDLLDEYPYPLLHGPAAAVILQNEFFVTDTEILESVHYHTTGKENMNLLTKIIYLADFIEPGRKFQGVEKVREAVERSLDEAIIISSGMVIIHTVRKGKSVHIDTINARNYLLENFNEFTLDF